MICENCGKEHDGSYGSGRFCNKSCAIAFGNKHRIRKKKEKIVVEKIKYCPICGRQLINNICENEFCHYHNPQHFRNLIKYFGFNKEKYGTIEVEEEFNRVRDILFDLYWNKNMSSTQLAKMFNYKSTPTNITQKFFKVYLNIPVKSVKYSVKENFLEGRENINSGIQYKQQWHTTWNGKEVYLRSSYELDYANELDKQQIDYDVECLRIKYFDHIFNEYKCAIPDFYIPSTNTIVEIKSNWTLDKQNMKDKMKAYLDLGYNFKLICEHKEIKL